MLSLPASPVYTKTNSFSPEYSPTTSLNCPLCLDNRMNATLSCTPRHKICLICAEQMYGKVIEDKAEKPGSCPLGCTIKVVSYVECKIPVEKKFNVEKKNDENQESKEIHLGMISTGYSLRTIKACFQGIYLYQEPNFDPPNKSTIYGDYT